MLLSVNIDDILIDMIYGRRSFQTRNYPYSRIQTRESDFAEYTIDKKAVVIEKGCWHPKRILTLLIPHIVKIMEDSVMVTCIYSFGLYQSDQHIAPGNYAGVDKYIEVIFKFEDPPGTAERLITESLESMSDYGRFFDEDEGKIILNVFKSEIFFKDDGYTRKFDLTVYKDDDCIICTENKSDILFCNCGHLIICEGCYHKYREDKCPKCRKINDTIKKKKFKIYFLNLYF